MSNFQKTLFTLVVIAFVAMINIFLNGELSPVRNALFVGMVVGTVVRALAEKILP